MKKKILIASIIIFIIIAILIIGWDLYVEIEPSYKGLEFIIPLVCKREVITLTNGDFPITSIIAHNFTCVKLAHEQRRGM